MANLYLKIQNRLGETFSLSLLQEMVAVVVECMKEDLVLNRAISIPNLGTITPYLHSGHMGVNIHTKKKVFVPAFRSVHFRPHAVFRRLLAAQAHLKVPPSRKSTR